MRIKELLAGTALVLALSSAAFAQTAPTANVGCVKAPTMASAGGSESPKLAAAGGSESPKLASAGQPCG